MHNLKNTVDSLFTLMRYINWLIRLTSISSSLPSRIAASLFLFIISYRHVRYSSTFKLDGLEHEVHTATSARNELIDIFMTGF